MRGSGIPIWFFIGVLLVIYGVMILGYGVFEWTTGSYAPGVQLTNLHTPVWWGGLLAGSACFTPSSFAPAAPANRRRLGDFGSRSRRTTIEGGRKWQRNAR